MATDGSTGESSRAGAGQRKTQRAPVIAMFCLLAFLWWAYHFTTRSPVWGMILLSIFMFLTAWSYFAVAMTDPGSPACEEWKEWLDQAALQGQAVSASASQLASSSPADEEVEGSEVRRRWKAGEATFCHKCKIMRPERAHHCKRCGVCYLRMDHHCHWIGNCVGWRNQKYFMLVNFWGFWACITALTTMREPDALSAIAVFVHPEKSPLGHFYIDPWLPAAFLVAICFVLCIDCCVRFMQCMSMARSNQTSIELSYEGSNPYCLSEAENLKQTYGKSALRWLLPVPPDDQASNGTNFALATKNESQYGSTSTSD